MPMSSIRRLVASMRISRRLAVISLTFTAPIGLMLYLIVVNINRDIDFGALELQGNRFERPLVQVLNGLAEHRLAAGRVHAGEAGADASLRDSGASIDQGFEALAGVQGELGDSLQF